MISDAMAKSPAYDALRPSVQRLLKYILIEIEKARCTPDILR
jgi:hypothetical protein